MSPLASIDVGSNSIRLLIGTVRRGIISPIRYERKITRLSQGIKDTELIQKPNMENTLKALAGFLRIIKTHKASHIKAVGTSALREAENSGDFIDRVFSELGIKIIVISGMKEAGLTAKGVLSAMDAPKSCLIIDIGGGSTEWILSESHNVLNKGTLSSGVVKLLEKHIHSDLPSSSDISSLEKDLNNIAKTIREKVIDHIDGKTKFITTAGTATTLAAIDLGLTSYDRQRVHMHEIKLPRLMDMVKMLIKLPLKERAEIKGLEPERADLIIPGIHFTIKIMEHLGFKKVIISDSGLLEGVLLMLSEEVQD